MRFVISGEWTRNRLLVTIIWMFLLYTFLLWISNALLFFDRMSLSPASIQAYYCGDEAKFRPARSYHGLLEVAHAHLFSIGVMLLTLTHLVLFVPLPNSLKVGLILVPFGSGLLNEAAGWLTALVHPGFAYLKVFSFILLEASLLVLMLLVCWALWSGAPSAYGKGGERGTRTAATAGAGESDGAGT